MWRRGLGGAARRDVGASVWRPYLTNSWCSLSDLSRVSAGHVVVNLRVQPGVGWRNRPILCHLRRSNGGGTTDGTGIALVEPYRTLPASRQSPVTRVGSMTQHLCPILYLLGRPTFLVLLAVAFALPGQARAESISLVWDASPEQVTSYVVHWGTQSGAYTESADVGNVTGYEVTGLTAGPLYYFVVHAYNGAGASPSSDEVSGSVQAPQFRTLTVGLTGTGGGSVSSLPSGISCGLDCSEAYPQGTAVVLTPVASDKSTSGRVDGAGELPGGDDGRSLRLHGDVRPGAGQLHLWGVAHERVGRFGRCDGQSGGIDVRRVRLDGIQLCQLAHHHRRREGQWNRDRDLHSGSEHRGLGTNRYFGGGGRIGGGDSGSGLVSPPRKFDAHHCGR